MSSPLEESGAEPGNGLVDAETARLEGETAEDASEIESSSKSQSIVQLLNEVRNSARETKTKRNGNNIGHYGRVLSEHVGEEEEEEEEDDEGPRTPVQRLLDSPEGSVSTPDPTPSIHVSYQGK
jgi:hypothetical protein